MRGKARFVPVSAAFDVLINEGRIYKAVKAEGVALVGAGFYPDGR
jgi:hypothetical protein